MRCRHALLVAVGIVLATSGVLPVGATNPLLPLGGSAQKVAAAIAASTSITSLPTGMVPNLSQVSTDTSTDTSFHLPGGGCSKIHQTLCTFGKTHSHKVVVILGDSHVWMWLPALVPGLKAAGDQLQVLWRVGCPDYQVTVWNSTGSETYDTGCVSWRASILHKIAAEKPLLVLLTERTTDIYTSPTTILTPSQLTAGLDPTITALQGPHTKVVVIGDIPAVTNEVSPPACLSVHPTAVQDCTTPVANPDAPFADLWNAEKAATVATGAGFIDPIPWICTSTTCSPVVGTYEVYYDWSHLDATYASYLSGVMGTAVKKYL
jgi:hypothetical protein